MNIFKIDTEQVKGTRAIKLLSWATLNNKTKKGFETKRIERILKTELSAYFKEQNIYAIHFTECKINEVKTLHPFYYKINIQYKGDDKNEQIINICEQCLLTFDMLDFCDERNNKLEHNYLKTQI